jgi:hypothetical protein
MPGMAAAETTDPRALPGTVLVAFFPAMSEASWRANHQSVRCDVRAVADARASRQRVVDRSVSKRVLWPLIDHAPSCRLCAAPRQPPVRGDIAQCRSCRRLVNLYDNSLTDLYPISYTTPRWRLCAGIRELKDTFYARSDNLLARDIGAVLSAYLESQLTRGRLGLPGDFGIVTSVPSSRPAIAAALRRATDEGWWSPELAVSREPGRAIAASANGPTPSASTSVTSGK